MGSLFLWATVIFAVYLVFFGGDLTRGYNIQKNKDDTVGTQSSDPRRSGNSGIQHDRKAERRNFLSRVNRKESDVTTRTEKDFIPQAQSSVSGNKRALPAAALAVLKNPKVQEAVIDKGIEVVGKLVDKQFENIERAQNKAADFLKKEVKLDITPDKAWINDNMFVPSAYHLDASVEGGSKSPEEKGDTPFIYPAGMGQVLMNGCWGTDYKIGDPCYNAKRNSTICWDMIDGAAFMGVGFDGSGMYSPESRKMSIVQRNCANKATYDNLDVPDTMNVHGIYDTGAFMMTFESRTQYQQYLQREAGVSGSVFGFSAGVKKAWGGSMQASTQQYMAVLDVDIDRYEIFMDEVKPSDLSLNFLREYMDLPFSYFHPGAQIKYQNFIQRWGTHYIKSAKFGGQLEIIKTMVASSVASKSEFAETMEAEYRGLFASAGAKSSTKGGSSSKAESKFTSTSVMAQGGSQEIATILADVYSPTFKGDFKEWLQSIPAYPKAFRFLLGTITDLVNFRANDLFPEESVDWGCEGHTKDIVEDTTGETVSRYYTVVDADGNQKKFYCPFQDRQALDVVLRKRRASLNRAIEIYMDEGPISISDMQIPECKSRDLSSEASNDFLADSDVPTWKDVMQANTTVRVTFDMENDLARGMDGVVKIQKNMTREVRFKRGRWYTADTDGKFHMYSGYRNGKTSQLKKQKLSIFGLVLSYNSKDGSLELSEEDFNESKKIYPTLREEMIGFPLARVSRTHSDSLNPLKRTPSAAPMPCNVKWSNALRLDPTTTGGRCLHFTASSAGDMFVIFATVPSKRSTWYYVQIGVNKVAIYKGETELTTTSDTGAVAIGDTLLYQSYFVCLYEKPDSTLIEYGKTLGTSDGGDIYLMHLDTDNPLNVRFYAFGNANKGVKIWDAHILPRDTTDADCKGDTYKDLPTNLCVQKCHQYCDPFAGCRSPGAEDLQPSDCLACRVAKDPLTNTCLEKCPKDTEPVEGKECLATFDAKTVYTEATAPLLRITPLTRGVEVQQMPYLNHMTLCVWTKMPRTSVTGFRHNILVKYHEESSEKGFFLSFLHWDGAEASVPPYGSITFQNPDRYFLFSKTFLDDYNWHHVCVTWNGVTGVTVAYVDGVKDITGKGGKDTPGGIIKGSLPGGGTLTVLSYYSQVVYLSGLNLWNRVLSAQEIEESSKSCVKSNGNVKQWSDFWSGFKTDKSRYDSPSKCKSPRASPEEALEGNGAEAASKDLAVGNKSNYWKLKKQAAMKYSKKGD